jgi:hypothetical protein
MGVLVLFCAVKLVQWLPRDAFGDGLSIWAYSDWLIDYSAGFVRRGLSGELLNLTTSLATPRVTIGIFSWLVFAGVVVGYIRLCLRARRRLSPLLMAAMLFLPSLLPFYLFDHGAFGRKETIGFLFVIAHLWLLESRARRVIAGRDEVGFLNSYLRGLGLLAAVALPVHVLSHEVSFLMFMPVHVLITRTVLQRETNWSRRRRWGILAAAYAPAVLAFGVVSAWGRPDFGVAQAICRKWELAQALPAGASQISGGDPTWALPGALTALPWSLSQAASLTASLSLESLVAWFLLLALLGVCTAYFGARVARAQVAGPDGAPPACCPDRSFQKLSAKYFLLPVLISAPLYVVGWDLGRWFAVSCINFALVCLSRDLLCLEFGISPRADRASLQRAPLLGGRLRRYLVTGALVAVVLFVRMPHCNDSGLGMLTSPVVNWANRLPF